MDDFAAIVTNTTSELETEVAVLGTGQLIAEAGLGVETGGSVPSLANVIVTQPTLSETLMESVESNLAQATHFYRPKGRF